MTNSETPNAQHAVYAASEALSAHTRPAVLIQREILAELVTAVETCNAKHRAGGRKSTGTALTSAERVKRFREKRKSKIKPRKVK